MIKASKRLKIVLKLAQMKQQQAAEQLAKSQRQADSIQQQSQQLKDYQYDYNDRFSALANSDVSAAQLANYQRFYGSLEDAVFNQQQQLNVADSQLERARQYWQAEYAREQNMLSLIERKQSEEQLSEEKLLQKEQDARLVIRTGLFNKGVK